MQHVSTEFKYKLVMKTVKQEQKKKYVMRKFPRERVKGRLKEDYFQLETKQTVVFFRKEMRTSLSTRTRSSSFRPVWEVTSVSQRNYYTTMFNQWEPDHLPRLVVQ